MEKTEKPLRELKFYAIYDMEFGHRITYGRPNMFIYAIRLLKAHTKLLEANSRLLEDNIRVKEA